MALFLHSFIIRIIRYKPDIQAKTIQLDGVVEDAEGAVRQPFHNADELWSILCKPDINLRHENTEPNNRGR